MAGLATALTLPSTVAFSQSTGMTAREVFQQIKLASGQPWDPNPTDDRIIYGDRNARITGIATCFFASMEVLRQAKEAGLNYIIPHEASFYERYDDFAESVLPDADPVLSAKRRFLDQNGMVIQRMHGHAHSRPGDAIMTGLLEQLDWKQFRDPALPGVCVKLPDATAIEIGRHIKQACGRRTLRMFGNPDQRISTISVSAGMPGENAQIAQFGVEGVDAVLLGEVREPEVLGYAQDLEATKPVVVFLAGHTAEDFGMRNIAEWLGGVFPGLPCRWLSTADPYTNPA
ncbi:MAG: Nif3-like dinuclear metal center hexameric protein [Porphyrobacter sp.]|nr:Nif3-like dinuclear metal center hexameric protein [Porphyrobacter sp.]